MQLHELMCSSCTGRWLAAFLHVADRYVEVPTKEAYNIQVNFIVESSLIFRQLTLFTLAILVHLSLTYNNLTTNSAHYQLQRQRYPLVPPW